MATPIAKKLNVTEWQGSTPKAVTCKACDREFKVAAARRISPATRVRELMRLFIQHDCEAKAERKQG